MAGGLCIANDLWKLKREFAQRANIKRCTKFKNGRGKTIFVIFSNFGFKLESELEILRHDVYTFTD